MMIWEREYSKNLKNSGHG